MSTERSSALPAASRGCRFFPAGLLLFSLAVMASCGGGGGGGGSSAPPPSNPIPTITSLSPNTATAGAAAQTLTITGTNFISSSTATYNGIAHAVTYVSATQLAIPLSANDQATAGSYPVVVTNPSPGGGASGAVNFTVNPAPTITSVSMSCNANSVPTGQTVQCIATVAGTGPYNSAVSWSVNSVTGGNSTFGTIAGSGTGAAVYTAPAAVPNPYTITIAATSVADNSKAADASIIVAGAIASVTQTVPAATGGTLTLPDGSSASIPPEVLPVDESVTLSEVSALAQPPPNEMFVGVGPALVMAFSIPLTSSAETRNTNRARLRSRRNGSPEDQSTNPGFTFSINEVGVGSGLSGAFGLANLTDVGNNAVFFETPRTTTGESPETFSSLTVDPTVVSAAPTPISSLAGSLGNTITAGSTIESPSPYWCLDATIPTWDSCSSSDLNVSGEKVLVMIHGMMSCANQTFPAGDAALIKGYYRVFGFDYDWTKDVSSNATTLKKFIDQTLGSPKQIDIIAHSEGVPVSLYAAAQSDRRGLIGNYVGLGGPLLGTPVANDTNLLVSFLLNWEYKYNLCPDSGVIGSELWQYLSNSVDPPFQADLRENSDTLVKKVLPLAKANLGYTRIYLVGGKSVDRGSWFLQKLEGSPFGPTKPNDGIVGLDSALGYGSGLKLYPLYPFPKSHRDLPQDTSTHGVLDTVSIQLNQSSVPPALDCVATQPNCEGSQDSLFTFTGTGFSNDDANLKVYSQDSTGTVTTLQEATLLDNSGSVNWTTTPQCSDPTGLFSVFTFDTSEWLASNNVFEQVDVGNCGPANPVPAISSLSPNSLAAGSPAQVLTISGTGFLASSSVTFNNIPHSATMVNSSQITISLTSADLAIAGVFSVVVTNPLPGGGPSNVAHFTVSDATTGTVTLSPTSVTVPAGGAQTFAAVVAGSADGVTWSIQEGASGGAIASSTPTFAVYSPPSTTGTFHVVATNADDSTQSAVATVTVGPALTLAVLHVFQPSQGEGSGPVGGLIQASDGYFYGSTYGGGAPDDGTVFKIDSAGKFTNVYSFTGGAGGSPEAGLILGGDGYFYGTTYYGGDSGRGTAYKMDASGTVTFLHSFSEPGPTNPYAGLLQGSDGNFYGTTYYGGPTDVGTVFRMDASGAVTLLHAFSWTDGGIPRAGLVQAKNGNLYGTTYYGGAFSGGVVYKLDSSGKFSVVHSFSGPPTDGQQPFASLLLARDGNLYGTTLIGGAHYSGTIFKIDGSDSVTVLHSFAGPDGADPYSPLIQGSDGNLYGTTSAGGTSGQGTIFTMDLAGNLTVLYSFSNADAGYVNTPVTQGKDGNLYGTGQGGTIPGNGVVFRLDLPATAQ